MVSSEFIPFRGRHGFVRPNPNLRQWQAWIELKKHDMLLIATSRTLNSIAEPRAHVIANKARISNWRTKKCSSRVDGTRLIFLYFARFLSQRMKHFNESSLLNACVSITKLCACRKYEPIVVARKQAVIECWLGRVYSFRLVLRNYSAKRISKCLHVSSVHVFIWINRPRLIKHLNRIEQQIENCAYVLRNRWAILSHSVRRSQSNLLSVRRFHATHRLRIDTHTRHACDGIFISHTNVPLRQ